LVYRPLTQVLAAAHLLRCHHCVQCEVSKTSNVR
jgi:hypothetical protein